MPERTARERAAELVKTTLARLHEGADLVKKRAALFDTWGQRQRGGKAWDAFLIECNLALNEPLVALKRHEVRVSEHGVECDWCADQCRLEHRAPGCPFCLPARREFEAAKSSSGGGRS